MNIYEIVVDKLLILCINFNIPYGIINNSQTDFKRKGNGMLEFVKKVFRGFIEVILWINLVVCIVGGGVAGYYIGGGLINYQNKGGYVFLGIIIGLICGILTNVVWGGYIATILNIDKNLEQIKSNMESDSSSR